VSNNFGGCPAPPFSGVVGSDRGYGMNISSRVNRAGFTGTRGVLVSAVPSAGVGGPAPSLGRPGIEVMRFALTGEVYRRVAVAVSAMSAHAGEHPIGQRQIATDGTARWSFTGLRRRGAHLAAGRSA
jgi:hypothetical protein